MTPERTIGKLAALCGMSVAVALLSNPPLAVADELADLRANQELLQRRLDQLAQAPPAGGPSAPTLAGAFPRSFLIPGTDTSIRIGGAAIGRITWYLRGVGPSADLFGQGNALPDRSDNPGGNGNLPGIPLNNQGASHAKSAAFFISGKSTRIFVDARTPTAWGQAQAYAEFDFGTANSNVLANGAFTVVPNNPARLRQGYAALGPWLLGVTNGSFTDGDSDMEVIDDAGQLGGNTNRARVPQLRYTWVTPWPGVTVLAALEQPISDFASPFGPFASDYTNAVATAACANAATSLGPLATTGTPINAACVPLGAMFDAAQAREPAGVFIVRLDDTWGHLRVGAVLRDAILNDGRIDKTWLGYGGTISGDVRPFPFWSPKDDIGFSVAVGEGIGGYIQQAQAVATNFGGGIGGQNPTIFGGMAGGTSFNTTSPAGLAARAAYDAGVVGKTITAFAAKLGYQHWWAPELRTNIDFSMIHQDIPNLINAGGPGSSGAANKELNSAHVNLLWSPVAFVTTGVEYSWGHRIVKSNAKGDEHVIQGLLRVNF